jgi:lipoprotein-releasing system permease protein
MLSWMIFRHYLLSRRSGSLVRLIAWLCMAGVGIGVASLIIVLSVMNGFNIKIRQNMLNVEPHLVISNLKSDQADLVHKLIPSGIESFWYAENQDVVLRTADGVFSGAIAKGLQPQGIRDWLKHVWKPRSNDPTYGKQPDMNTLELGPHQAVIGVDLASNLGVFDGDDLFVIPPETLLMPKGEVPKYEKVTIKGIISTQMPDIDGKLFIYNSDNTMKGWWKNSASIENGFEIRLTNPYDADKLAEKIRTLGQKIQSWHERNTALFFALKMESLAMTIFLSLAVLITSFSIVSVMVLLITQKRREMGMLQAMGFSKKATRRAFTLVGVYLSVIGVGAGVIFGCTVALLMDYFPIEVLPDIYYDSTLPAHLSSNIVIGVIVGAAILASIGAYVPVRLYVDPTPADSLRGR